MNKQPRTTWSSGFTLAEMLVAVAITVMMLLITGMVFKSSSNAAGRAMAHIEMMRNLRSFTNRLQAELNRDKFQADMPFAVIFERYNNNPDSDPVQARWVRRDRIVFFTTGDFTANYSQRGNLAQVFYGQGGDPILMAVNPPDEPVPTAPRREILGRRMRVLTSDIRALRPDRADWPSPFPTVFEYDSDNLSEASEALWKNEPFQAAVSGDTDYRNNYFIDDPLAPESIIRRPLFFAPAQSTQNIQQMYILPDVTDFKIQFWFTGTGDPAYDNRWLPEDYDWPAFDLARSNKFAMYWNCWNENDKKAVVSPYILPLPISNIAWWSDEALKNTNLPFALKAWQNAWPTAMKISFTLYDKGRTYFPDGRTFTYVVKLPPRR